MTGKWIENWEDELDTLTIKAGGHISRDEGVCVMEAVAWLRSQKHSDKPVCVSPVMAAFFRSWNDGLPSDAERNRLLKPFIPIIVDTIATPAVESKRSYMALDWLVRVNAPAFLGLTDSLKAHAVALSSLMPIVDKPSLDSAKEKIDAARAAAWAAGDAAGAAAWAAAWAARDAAWAAARAAGDALKPTVSMLQDSASDLVRRMAAAK